MTEVVWDNIHPTTDVRLGRSPYQQGRDEERAAIVAWLTAASDKDHDSTAAAAFWSAVEAIEAGEHLQPSADQ